MFNIVVIEDSNFMRTRITKALRDIGYTITEFSSADSIGRKPHAYLDEVDLIISDIMLPGLSGLDLLSRIKKEPIYSHIPVIFVSGCKDADTIKEAFRAGVSDYIVKPFDDSVLILKVNKILGVPVAGEFILNENELKKTLSMEYQRAKRGYQSLSIVRFQIEKTNFNECIYQIRNNLRMIDTVCVYKNYIIIILPLTNEIGLEVVTKKISGVLKKNEIEFLDCDTFTCSDMNDFSNDFMNLIHK